LLDLLGHQTHVVARLPSRQTRHDVLREHGLAIMKLESSSQTERPNESVRRGFLALDHLATRLKLVVDAVKHVPHQRGAVAHDVLGVPDRIEIGEIGLRHEAQHARGGALRDRGSGKRVSCGEDAGAGYRFQERPSIHEAPIPVTANHQVGYMTGARVSPVAP
jgi:hypothetical protein